MRVRSTCPQYQKGDDSYQKPGTRDLPEGQMNRVRIEDGQILRPDRLDHVLDIRDQRIGNAFREGKCLQRSNSTASPLSKECHNRGTYREENERSFLEDKSIR